MSQSISHSQTRKLERGMGTVLARETSGGITYQARWWDGTRRKAKTFFKREDAEEWLRVRGSARKSIGSPNLHDTSLVYFVQGIDGGPIKIGRADEPALRLRELQLGSPVLLQLLAVVKGGRYREACLHEQFAILRMHGEWFSPGVDLLQWIASHATVLSPRFQQEETRFPASPARPLDAKRDAK